MDENLEKLKNFESLLKKCLSDFFGKFLPENTMNILNQNSYINMETINSLNSREEIQGYFLRSMLNDVVNITYNKDESNSIYGKYIEDLVKEDYAKLISNKYSFNIDDGIKDENEFIELLREKLNEKYDYYMLNTNLKTILEQEGLQDIINYLDQKNISSNQNENTQIISTAICEYSTESGKVQIVYINNQKYLQYSNINNENYSIKINNDSNIEMYFNERISNLPNDTKLPVEILFAELLEFIENELENKKNVNNENNNIANQLPNLSNISNGNLKYPSIEADTNHEIVQQYNNEQQNYGLTQEQLSDLLSRNASGELTEEERKILMSITPEILLAQTEEISGPSLRMNSRGKTNKLLLLYLFIFGILVVGIFLLIVTKK